MRNPFKSRLSQDLISNASERQALFRRSIRLLPVLARRGVEPYDAIAIAFNAVFLFCHMPRRLSMLSPRAVLRKYSYAEIASLCEHALGTAEFAVNKNLYVNEHGRQFMCSSTHLRSKEALP